MTTQRRDFLVGLFLLVGIGVLVGMAIVTSGLGERRSDYFLRAASAEALTQDTRVVLGGLGVGRVRAISPVVDTVTGAVSFVARLSITQRFPNGTQLRLPLGTEAVISQPTPIAAAVVDLRLPEPPTPGAYLAPGDTVESTRPPNVLDALAGMATELRAEIRHALRETRTLLARSTSAVEQTQRVLATNAPLVTQVLARLANELERTDTLLATLTPRVAPLADSVAAVLADARRSLASADSAFAAASAIAGEHRETAREIAERLLRTAIVLEHFSDQISRRPLRVLSGVRPPDDTGPSLRTDTLRERR